jgi:hypothetical protein
MATCTPAALLRLPDRGSLHVGKLADMIILPAATPLSAASRADVKLVLIDGVVRYGDPELAGRFAPDTPFNEICVDGRQKVLDCRIANRLSRASLRERGLTLSNVGCVAA